MAQHVASLIACAKFVIAVPQPGQPSVQEPQLLLTRRRGVQASLQRAGERERQMRRTDEHELARMLDWSAIIMLRNELHDEVLQHVHEEHIEDVHVQRAMFLAFLEVRRSLLILSAR